MDKQQYYHLTEDGLRNILGAFSVYRFGTFEAGPYNTLYEAVWQAQYLAILSRVSYQVTTVQHDRYVEVWDTDEYQAVRQQPVVYRFVYDVFIPDAGWFRQSIVNTHWPPSTPVQWRLVEVWQLGYETRDRNQPNVSNDLRLVEDHSEIPEY